MKIKIVKIFLAIGLTGLVSVSADELKEKIDNMQKFKINSFVSKKEELSFDSMKFFGSSKIGTTSAYFYKVKINNKKGKDLNIPDIVYTDGNFVFSEIRDLNIENDANRLFVSQLKLMGKPLKKTLISGSGENKNKIVIFSDPICPSCVHNVPKVIDKFKNKDFDIYYNTYLVHDDDKYAIAIANIIDYIQSKKIKWDNILLSNNLAKLKTVYGIRDYVEKQLKIDIPNEVIENKKYVHNELSSDNFILGTPTFFLNSKRINAQKLLEER